MRSPAPSAELTPASAPQKLSRPSLRRQQFFRGHHRTNQDHLPVSWTEDHQATDRRGRWSPSNSAGSRSSASAEIVSAA